MTIAVEPIGGRHRSSPAELLATAQRYAAAADDWPVTPRFDPDERWYHLLAEGPDVQAWLLSWLPGQSTGLHDHGGSSGAFVVVRGALREYTTAATQAGDRVERLTSTMVTTGGGRSFGPRYIHQITNTTNEPAVSLHVYGPALRVMTRYRVEESRLRAIAVERAGVDW